MIKCTPVALQPWPVVALNELGFDWIEANYEDNRNGRGGRLRGKCGGGAPAAMIATRRRTSSSVISLLTRAIVAVGAQFTPFVPPQSRSLSPLGECGRNGARVIRRQATQKANNGHRRLGTRRERPHCCAPRSVTSCAASSRRLILSAASVRDAVASYLIGKYQVRGSLQCGISVQRMTAVGQTRRLSCLGMSASPPTSDGMVASHRTGASGHLAAVSNLSKAAALLITSSASASRFGGIVRPSVFQF